MTSRYFNDVGEPLMTAEQARFEDYLDEQSAHDYDYDEVYQDRRDSFFEDLYEQQADGRCPACAEYECEMRIFYDTDQRIAYHKEGQ